MNRPLDRRFVLTLAAGLCCSIATAGGQNAADIKPPPPIELSAAQRQLIYSSLSKQTHVSRAAPPEFAASVGAVVPQAVELAPLPDTVIQTVPQTRGYAFAFIANQVLLVDPTARRIVEIISQS